MEFDGGLFECFCFELGQLLKLGGDLLLSISKKLSYIYFVSLSVLSSGHAKCCIVLLLIMLAFEPGHGEVIETCERAFASL